MADETSNSPSLSDSLIQIPRILSSAVNYATSELASRSSCQNTCMSSCQNYCEVACQSSIMSDCGATCQNAGQQPCKISCQTACESACQSSCQSTCQSACESSAQSPSSSGSITITSRTSTSISLQLSAISAATYYVVAYRPTTTSAADTYRTTSLSVTISGLSPNTEYAFNYYAGNDYGTGPYMSSPVYATTLPPLRAWEWWSTIEAGQPLAVTASEWNAFTDRINEFLDYYGISQRSFTPAVSGTAMKADLANAASAAIGALRPAADASYYPGWLNAGDTITAAYFIGLKNYLNSAMP